MAEILLLFGITLCHCQGPGKGTLSPFQEEEHSFLVKQEEWDNTGPDWREWFGWHGCGRVKPPHSFLHTFVTDTVIVTVLFLSYPCFQ